MSTVPVEPAATSWRGVFAFGPWWLLYVGPVAPTDYHRHHAVQLVLTSDSSPLVESPDRRQQRSGLEIIPSDVPHRIRRTDRAAAIVFLDPESQAGRSITAIPTDTALIGSDSGGTLHAVDLRCPPTWADAARLVADLLVDAGLTDRGLRILHELHPAVTVALGVIADQSRDLSLRVPEIASIAGVSASRLSHLFTNQVGIPIRRYQQWLRLVTAADHLSRGASMTEAAHRAGFADGAHFSRVFRSTFGSSPSASVGHATWLTPPAVT